MLSSRRIKKLIETAFGLRLFRTLPRGINVFTDIRQALPEYQMEVLFDVGANIGQTAVSFAQAFPNALIYSFEPVRETYRHLVEATRHLPNVHCNQFAFSSVSGKGKILADGVSTVNRLVGNSEENQLRTESVEILTLDDFCRAFAIPSVGYVKIDTEGNDLEVLKGASRMLSEQSFDFVEIEAGMNPKNHYHVPIEKFKKHLEEMGYLVFGVYEQVNERPTNQPQLRRANFVFISSRLTGADVSIDVGKNFKSTEK